MAWWRLITPRLTRASRSVSSGASSSGGGRGGARPRRASASSTSVRSSLTTGHDPVAADLPVERVPVHTEAPGRARLIPLVEAEALDDHHPLDRLERPLAEGRRLSLARPPD